MIAWFCGYAAMYAVCICAVAALRRRLWLHPLLLLYGYLISVILIEQSYAILLVNLEAVKPGQGWMPYVIIRLHGFVFVPAVLLSLAALLLRPGGAAKWLYAGIGVALLILGEYGLTRAGFLRIPNWHAAVSFLLNTGIVAVSFAYLRWIAGALRKRGVAV